MADFTERRLLAVFAHPDDETFLCGGALARYASEGGRVSLVCGTRGEVGEISDPNLARPENLGKVREEELRAACRVLGVRDVIVLGYRDSGMNGTEDNDHPDAFSRADMGDLVGRVVEVVRRMRPQVLLTFDPNGGYGHPDHVAAHTAAVEAFSAASDPSRYPEQLIRGLQPHRPERLYYAVFPRSAVKAIQDTIREMETHSDFLEIDPESMGVPDEEITTVLDVGGYADRKQEAARCHKTQVQGDDPFDWLPDTIRWNMLSREHFVRVAPPFNGSAGSTELDLFRGESG